MHGTVIVIAHGRRAGPPSPLEEPQRASTARRHVSQEERVPDVTIVVATRDRGPELRRSLAEHTAHGTARRPRPGGRAERLGPGVAADGPRAARPARRPAGTGGLADAARALPSPARSRRPLPGEVEAARASLTDLCRAICPHPYFAY
ncbi:hypothetical protein [Actinomadura macrotermitis]|uniref:hypothetical protein n=1 Tax=Actinomadura macrotermitis TaxID=2585200 RepID=UPI0012972687|nr:hypothetical protein [Actinomadura macrotermitis]